MTDETTTTNAATADVRDGILDLRPPKSGIVYQLLRLGLTFDHRDESGETWTDYTRGVTAVFKDRSSTEATLSDMDTKDSRPSSSRPCRRSWKSRRGGATARTPPPRPTGEFQEG